MLKEDERIDDLQLKGLKLIQNPKWFCFGIDAVLLSDFAKVKKKDIVADLGTGNGIIPLLMYGKYEPARIVGVEIQSEVAQMALRSVQMNGLSERIEIFNGDIKDCCQHIGTGCFDAVVSNPPYKKGDTGLVSPEDQKAISRSEILIKLEELVYTAARLLKTGGKFYMIHRPERLKDIIIELDRHKLTVKRIRFVHPKANKSPNMLLVEAVKAGGEFLKIEEPLYVYNEDGSYTDEIDRIYGRC